MNTIVKISVVITFLFFSVWTFGQPSCLLQVYVDGSIVKWVYSGGDEFNSSSLDTTKWYTCSGGWNREHGLEELQYYLDDNITIDNGILKLTAKYQPGNYPVWRQDENGNYYQTLKHFDYTSGWIQSKQKYKCGLFEIRFKLPEGNGLWPAFWLFGGYPNEEIDVFEYLGETPNIIYCTVHYPPHSQYHNGITTTGNFSEGFNDMMGQWDDSWVFWHLNETHLCSWLGTLNYQASIRANLAVACQQCFGSVGPDSTTPFPSVFEIDFIRIWTRYDCEQDKVIENYHQTITDPTVITGNSVRFTNNGEIQPNQYLTVIASEEIKLEHGFNISEGGYFSTRITECPIWGRTESGVYAKDQVVKVNEYESFKKQDNKSENNSITNYASLDYDGDSSVELTISVFPNPIHDLLHIELNGLIQRYISFSLFDSFGKMVYSNNNIRSNIIDIDVSNFNRGIYTLLCQIDKELFTEKVFIE